MGLTASLNYSKISLNDWLKSNLIFAITIALITTLWIYIKPLIIGFYKYQKVDREHKRFKRNATTFNALLNANNAIDAASLQTLATITIGNTNGLINLTLFLSPTCRHCHTAFEEAYQLLLKQKDKVHLSIAFNLNVDNKNNPYTIVPETIMSTYLNNGAEAALAQLIDWHIHKMSLESFIEKYKITVSPESKSRIDAHFNWCQQNGLTYAPIKLFNYKLFPDAYAISDIKYLLQVYED
jgi:hypothetical protein